jgi:hypothetical protein
MTLPLPHTLSSTDNEDGTPSIDRVQENFDELAKQFPIVPRPGLQPWRRAS